jgi:hypothetical protein
MGKLEHKAIAVFHPSHGNEGSPKMALEGCLAV